MSVTTQGYCWQILRRDLSVSTLESAANPGPDRCVIGFSVVVESVALFSGLSNVEEVDAGDEQSQEFAAGGRLSKSGGAVQRLRSEEAFDNLVRAILDNADNVATMWGAMKAMPWPVKAPDGLADPRQSGLMPANGGLQQWLPIIDDNPDKESLESLKIPMRHGALRAALWMARWKSLRSHCTERVSASPGYTSAFKASKPILRQNC